MASPLPNTKRLALAKNENICITRESELNITGQKKKNPWAEDVSLRQSALKTRVRIPAPMKSQTFSRSVIAVESRSAIKIIHRITSLRTALFTSLNADLAMMEMRPPPMQKKADCTQGNPQKRTKERETANPNRKEGKI